ncbi:SDR family NAD(P)-dependent oxidoreductase [Sporosarcina sp. FSL K6-3457]|uniref:SDR family NAD(P)-dependent oxidoreductase n=1 Tax=Sporosarcina sp. FSL K6-3457 TaxID=2978204 RepID=UPI0030FCA118
MNIDFSGKTVVVTGGTSGIGLAIAEKFLESNAKVAVCGRNQRKIDNLLEKWTEENCEGYAKAVDVTSRIQLSQFADQVEDRFGGIDIWINNAGVYPQYAVIDTPESVWDETININLKSVYLGSMIAQQKIVKRGGGVIINASSFAAVMPSAGSGVYAASKAGVQSLTKTLAAELAVENIRVNGYIPGVIQTNMTEKVIEAKNNALISQLAIKRIGTSEEVANAVLFLCSDQASYITGTFIEVSGGKFCVQNP